MKKKLALVAAGVSTAAVSAGAWAGIRRAQAKLEQSRSTINETLPVHSKWWRDTAGTEGELLYVALGDSAAQGIGASAPKNSYVGVIADHIRTVTGRTVRVVNLSVSGATVALAVADIAAFEPELFEAGIRKVLDALPDDAIVADLPYFYLPWNEKKVAVGNRILREVAAEHGLTVVPLHETMRREGVRGMLTQFAEDLFHPNDHGYRVWASPFLPEVTARVAERFPRRPRKLEAATEANEGGTASAAREQPTATEQPAATEQPTTTEQPAVTGRPAASA